MNKKLRLGALFLPLLVLLVLAVAGCATAAKGPPQAFTLKLVETSDIHGALFPYDFINDKEAATSLAQVYTYLQAERGREDQEVLFLDNGDILQGQPVVYYSNFEAIHRPHIAAQVMNYMGYDCATVGNHDIEAGHAVYDKLVKEFDFPWLAANAVRTDNGRPYFPPYAVFHKRGVKIVIFGLITPGVPTWLPVNLWEGMKFTDMVESAQTWVPHILEEEQPDLLVGLFHAGTDHTYGGYSADSELNPNAAQLVAEQVPGFDIIFVGHDHAGHNEIVAGPGGREVLILGAKNAARTLAVAEVALSYDSESGGWNKLLEGRIVEIEGYGPDAAFTAQFRDTVETVKGYVAKPIGNFTAAISTREAMFGDAPFVDLIHTIQLGLTGADLSFAAPLSFDATIRQGAVYVRDMFNLYKYENLLYTMELTGQQIKDYLEYSYKNWFNTMSGPEDHLLAFKRDEAGKLIWNERYGSYDLVARYYNYDSAAGIDYTVDVSKPPGQRIDISGLSGGRPFDLKTKYQVAINSYRATGGGGHITRGTGLEKKDLDAITLSSTVKDLRYYLMKWIEQQETVTPQALGNWRVVPTAWWEAGKARDYALLYEGKKEN